MIQTGTYLNVIDNSGAKRVNCIKILNTGYKQRYAKIGTIILVSIKSVRFSKNIKVKKGELCYALIIKTKTKSLNYSTYRKYFDNAVVLLNKKNNKLLGTRIFSTIPKEFKYTKFLKCISLSSGISL
jgi:large subunit ribosomal protein L14